MKSWEDIPTDQWIDGTIQFWPGQENWAVEFDWMGLNGHIYHRSPDEITFGDFADLYDELHEQDYEFEIETTPEGE